MYRNVRRSVSVNLMEFCVFDDLILCTPCPIGSLGANIMFFSRTCFFVFCVFGRCEYFEFLGHWPKQTLGFAPGDVSLKPWRRDQKLHIYPGYQCWGGGRSNLTKCKQEWSGRANSVQVSGDTLAEDNLSSICCPSHDSQN